AVGMKVELPPAVGWGRVLLLPDPLDDDLGHGSASSRTESPRVLRAARAPAGALAVLGDRVHLDRARRELDRLGLGLGLSFLVFRLRRRRRTVPEETRHPAEEGPRGLVDQRAGALRIGVAIERLERPFLGFAPTRAHVLGELVPTGPLLFLAGRIQ